MAKFELTVAQNKVSFSHSKGQPYTGKIDFSVKGLLDRRVKVRGSVAATEPAKAEWFTVDAEKTLETSATISFTVTIHIPAGTPPGDYSFKPVAASVDDPSEESELGPPVTITLAPPRPTPWWIFAIAGGAALVIAAVVLTIVLWPKGPKPNADAGVTSTSDGGATPTTGCTEDTDCPSEKNLCIRRACQAPLANQQNCHENRECASGHCLRASCAVEGACVDDKDCTAPQTCNRGMCSMKEIGIPCTTNTQCATGRCVHQVCGDVKQCNNDRDCGADACLFDWCRKPPLRGMVQPSPGTGARIARPGDNVSVEVAVSVSSGPLGRTGLRSFTRVVRLGPPSPWLTDVLLGLRKGGKRRLAPMPRELATELGADGILVPVNGEFTLVEFR